ncbi:pyrophosphatase [Leptospira levettii]|uniref:Nucleotide pyrophosphohydrolase n=2 Tax=Leptospira TaxID=171 RepID=A0A2N0AT85_9LEPT|nr:MULTISPECIES: nucleotide pyrophosphohydrolase [Leptospira]MBL0954034.1 nucleotide pyrophosphohydrolase [Leptospira sp.]MCW7467328.1 nucleotide pyrophosphohydrolase [Leptospira levettii]MCW7473113.1 nucleotide pyrophosphohydrolase [Leptospira levettii]MCW7498008.1 nucleotide pyrophosphohydrolase [Leptospira levettii]MCW7506063.1 nucleotide pyrophosphohydrolase [Leptospira paudalimensis]
MDQNDITLNQLQNEVNDWIQTIGVRYFSELTNLAILVEEVGELSRLMARKYGDQSFKSGESAEQIPSEIGDILFVLTCLANQMGISLQDVITSTIQKNTKRDLNRHKNNPKL